MGGYVRSGGLIVVSQRNYLLNRTGGSTEFSPTESNHTTPNAYVIAHDVGNARLPSERASSGHGRLRTLRRFDCCVAAKTPQIALAEVLNFSPPSSNHTTPNVYVVAHDGGNARVAPERASSGHGRR